MNASNAKDYLPLVQALAEGRVIEHKGRAGWYTADEPSFDFPSEQYRIKPEPREVWINRYINGKNCTEIFDSKQEAESDIGEGWYAVRYREVIE